jgi:hypothetical protein
VQEDLPRPALERSTAPLVCLAVQARRETVTAGSVRRDRRVAQRDEVRTCQVMSRMARDEARARLEVVVENQNDLPVARSTPACKAAFRPRCSTETGLARGSDDESCSRSWIEPSVEPSTTTTTSSVAGSASTGSSARRNESRRLNVGITTETDRLAYRVLSLLRVGCPKRSGRR